MRELRLMVAVVLTAFATVLPAQWNSDPTENNPICTQPEGQVTPAIVSDGEDGAIIAWVDYRFGISQKRIYAQRIDGAGTVQWAEDGVLVSEMDGNYGDVAMVDDGSGGAIILFRIYGNAIDVHGQHISGSGEKLWGQNGVAICTADHNQSLPSVISDGQGGIYLSWMDDRVAAWDIYGQHLDGSGVALWGTNGTPVCTMTGNASWPQVVTDNSGGVYVTWSDDRTDTLRAYAQHLDGGGNPTWISNGIELGSVEGMQAPPELAVDDAGGMIACWTGGSGDIFAQRVGPDGNLLWSPTSLAVCDTVNYQSDPYLVSDGTTGVYVVWADDRNPFSQGKLFAQHLGLDGTKLWEGQGIAVSDAHDCFDHTVARAFGGDLVTVWNVESDVRAQRMSASGETLWGSGASVVHTGSAYVESPCIAAHGTTAVVAWMDKRNSHWDIFCSKLLADGQLTNIPNNGTASPPYLASIADGRLHVVLDASSTWTATPRVFDGLGRLLASPDVTSTRTASLDLSRLPMGILFVALWINDLDFGLRLLNAVSAPSILR